MVKVLIVFAHEEATSFNAALKNVAVEALRRNGHDVTVSDLYAMKFIPVLSRNDIIGPPSNPEHFSYGAESSLALKNGCLAPDIVAEQKKVTEADLLILQFPMYGVSTPAILKGWLERVFSPGFGVDVKEGKLLDQGLMKGKKAVLSITTNCGPGWFTPDGLLGDLECILWPIQHCNLRFYGFEVLSPQLSYSVAFVDEATRKKMLADWDHRLQGIMGEEPPQKFPSLSNFEPVVKPENPVFGMRLKEEFVKTTGTVGPIMGYRAGKSRSNNPDD